MSIQYVVAHRKDLNNVGDIASNPLQYFLKPEQYTTIDVALLDTEHYPLDVPLIVGGGGLIGNNFMGNIVAKLLTSLDERQFNALAEMKWKVVDPAFEEVNETFRKELKKLVRETQKLMPVFRSPKYIWGAGHNGDAAQVEYPEELLQYDQVGLRDANTAYTWAPCASCMHPALQKEYSIKNKVIWFEHKKQLIKDRMFGSYPIPRFVNSGNNIEQTIELLGSAETILTNSYHGAYWGTLLGRRVIVVGAWSSKFDLLKHSPKQITIEQDWQDELDSAPIYKHALDECITATQQFWERIK